MLVRVALLLIAATLVGAAGCGASKATGKDPAEEVKQLMVLYRDARAKYVVQKQEIIQAESCDRATRLRQAVDKMADDAGMSPEPSEDVTLMKMELHQAEKDCLAK